MSFGIKLNNSIASFSKVSMQPKANSENVRSSSLVKPINSSQLISKVNTNSNLRASVSLEMSKVVTKIGSFSLKPNFALQILDMRNRRTAAEAPTNSTPFEDITGLNKKKPEIISMIQYAPLFDDESRPTIAHEFLTSQISIMNLRDSVFKKLVKNLKENEDGRDVLTEQKQEYIKHVKILTNYVDAIYSAVNSVDKNKNTALNLRNTSTAFSLQNLYSTNFPGVIGGVPSNFFARIGNKLNIIDTFKKLGYPEEKINKWTSTKLFLQLVENNRALISGARIKFGNTDSDATSVQIHDDEPGIILASATDKSLDNIRNNITYENLFDIVKKAIVNVDSIVKAESNSVLKTSKIFEILSKELKVSSALDNVRFKSLLKANYSYVVSENTSNSNFLYSILGPAANKIDQDTRSNGTNSINSTTLDSENATTILTFENDYIKKSNSTYTPGSSFYYEEANELTDSGFKVANLKRLSDKINGPLNSYIEVVGNLNLLPDEGNVNLQSNDFAAYTTPTNLLNATISNFINTDLNIPSSDSKSSKVLPLLDNCTEDFDLMANFIIYFLHKTLLVDAEAASSYVDKSILQIKKLLTRNLSFQRTIDITTGGLEKAPAFSLNTNVSKQFTKEVSPRIESAGSVNNSNRSAGVTSVSSNQKVAPVYLNRKEKIFLDEIEQELRSGSAFLTRFQNQFQYITKLIITNSISGENTSGKKTKYSGAKDLTIACLYFVGMCQFSKGFLSAKYSNATQDNGKTFFQKDSLEPDTNSAVQQSRNYLNNSQDLIALTSGVILSILKNTKDITNATIQTLQDKNLVNAINQIQKIIEDRDLLKLCTKSQQLLLVKVALDDLKSFINYRSGEQDKLDQIVSISDSPDEFNELDALDDAFSTIVTQKVIENFGRIPEYRGKRSGNSKILTVGLPSGFSENIKETAKIENISKQIELDNKQIDVLNFKVYKIDSEYPDMIFKPIEKIYELSRFVPRNENLINQNFFGGNSFKELVSAVPTKNYDLGEQTVSYSIDKIKEDNSYSFLNTNQKFDLIKNHVVSYVLENYIKLLTGIRINENEFYIDDPDKNSSPAPIIFNQLVVDSANKIFALNLEKNESGAKKFMAFSSNVRTSANVSLIKKDVSKLSILKYSSKQIKRFKTNIGHIEKSKGRKTFYNDTFQESKRLMSPKMFDRVFHMFIDSDEFEIDVTQTTKDNVGKKAFEQLRNLNKIIEVTDSSGKSKFYLQEKNKLQNDLTFEKYFVTVQTILESTE